ncbi:DUF92 domain-containing protein [Metabacillus iocasae]|nr:DUF92 domain-containing protein [Metabacillus iocasae]
MIEGLFVYVVIILVALFGYLVHSLSGSGAVAAALVGISIYIGYEIEGLIVLGVFFGTSTLWSKYKREKKRDLTEKVEKGDRRDWIQVFANGGIAALISICYAFSGWSSLVYLFLISLAAANSDTWASEIGSLSKRAPFFILSFKRVEKGTSGAVSLLGTCAALAGSFVIGYIGYLLFEPIHFYSLLFVTLFGFLGNLFDTLLGATIQVVYRCSVCSIKTERTLHCGITTVKEKGWTFFNNDVVNVTAIILSTVIGGIAVQLFLT